MPIIRPVKAHYSETVEIEWVCPDGTHYVERHTCPPTATLEAHKTDADRQRALMQPEDLDE